MRRERQIGVRVGLPAFFALEVEDVYKHESGAHRALTFPDFLGLLVGLGLEQYRKGNAVQPEPDKEKPDAAAVRNMTGYGEPPRPEGNIIRFHAPTGTQAPDPAEQPAHEEELSFTEHREAFKGVDFGGNPTECRILWALYRNRIHSIEKLARIPATKLLDCRRIGEKTLEQIRAALESRGIASEAWGIPETAVTQQEN
jgi:hypothetical protein